MQYGHQFALIPNGADVDLDMSGVEFVDCTGLRVPLDISSQLDRLHIQLRIVKFGWSVQRNLVLCRLSQHLEIVYGVASPWLGDLETSRHAIPEPTQDARADDCRPKIALA
ncbi:MAG: STAS domain-containing protein [Actinomycetota bacterium]|nr:STAS domain-containing protein [Actinomycetota bacterium]